jgi:two-component system alkaline phosphatase synthesis response regulator PhoP
VDGKRKILAVDDDSEVLQIVTDKLKSGGFNVVQAVNGQDGLRLAESEHPDLILLDLLMPIMGGLEVMKKLRESDEWGKNVPIIVITNVDPDENTVRAVAKAKPYYFFSKGIFSLDELVLKIRECLKI